jgi:hypothetical protein
VTDSEGLVSAVDPGVRSMNTDLERATSQEHAADLIVTTKDVVVKVTLKKSDTDVGVI